MFTNKVHHYKHDKMISKDTRLVDKQYNFFLGDSFPSHSRGIQMMALLPTVTWEGNVDLMNSLRSLLLKKSYKAPKFFTHRVNSKIIELGNQDNFIKPNTSKWYGLKTTELAEGPKPSNVSRNVQVSSVTSTYRKGGTYSKVVIEH